MLDLLRMMFRRNSEQERGIEYGSVAANHQAEIIRRQWTKLLGQAIGRRDWAEVEKIHQRMRDFRFE